jgi:WD40 repeat protein
MPLCPLWEETPGYSHIPVLISERPASWPKILEGHTDYVVSVAFSCDGKYIVSGSHDSTVRVWDTATGIQLCIMTDHEDAVNSVTFSGSGKKLRVISGSRDCTVRVWDPITGGQLRTMKHEQVVTSVAASHDSQLIVSSSGKGTIWVWDVMARTPLLVVQGHDDTVTSAGLSSDNKWIVSGSSDYGSWAPPGASLALHLRTCGWTGRPYRAAAHAHDPHVCSCTVRVRSVSYYHTLCIVLTT